MRPFKKVYLILANNSIVTILPSEDPMAMQAELRRLNPGVNIMVIERPTSAS